MSDDRRRQRRRDRQRRRRRERGPSYEPAGDVQFPGLFGWLQRRQRLFYAIGIVVLVVSLGAIMIGGQLGPAGPEPTAATPTPASEAAPASGAGAPPSSGGEDGGRRLYAAPPPMTIDPARSYEAVIRTERGDVRITLLPEDAPGYVNNFVFLAREGFYDGLTFHRVVPGFVAQAGDPTGTGSGSSGYNLAEERNGLPLGAGVLSMAKGGAVVSGSQFFVTLAPTPHLEGSFTAFGRVASGLDVLQSLTPRDPQRPGQPPGDRILAIDIVEGGPAGDADGAPAGTPAAEG